MNSNMDNYISFIPPTNIPVPQKDSDLWFMFLENEMLIIQNNNIPIIPTKKDSKDFLTVIKDYHYLGDFKGVPCYAYELKENPDPKRFSLIPLRKLASFISEELFLCCGRAYQILHWIHNNTFCGRCGCKTNMKIDELSRHCPNCSLAIYPKISPAVIVTVTKGDKILLAHNINFPKDLHSNVAGFLEPCETLEDCVKREVFEEVGIKIKNIRYFGNQPWPYPDSIMIGFTAEYESGEIKVDDCEIIHADWYSIDNLPLLPEKITIARKMIDSFIAENT